MKSVFSEIGIISLQPHPRFAHLAKAAQSVGACHQRNAFGASAQPSNIKHFRRHLHWRLATSNHWRACGKITAKSLHQAAREMLQNILEAFRSKTTAYSDANFLLHRSYAKINARLDLYGMLFQPKSRYRVLAGE